MPYLKKQSRTREQLKNALIHLVEAGRFEKISVGQLADSAGVTRSTLYRYYDDKYQLLEAVENDVVTGLVAASTVPTVTNEPTAVIDQVLHGYQAQFPALHALLGPHGDPAFADRLERRVTKLFYRDHPAKTIEDELIQLASTAMWLRVLQYWIFHSDRVTLPTIRRVILRLVRASGSAIH